MSTSSGTVNSGGNPDSYGEPSGRSEEPEVGPRRQLGFEVGQLQAQESAPIPTVEAPKSKPLADACHQRLQPVADVLAEEEDDRCQPRRRAGAHHSSSCFLCVCPLTCRLPPSQELGNRLYTAIEQSTDKICDRLDRLSDRMAHEADRLELEALAAKRGRMAREADL